LSAKHDQQQKEMDLKKEAFESTKKDAETAAELAKKLSDERHETELRLQELQKSEEDARKQADYLASLQSKERNAIQTFAQEMQKLQDELESARFEMTKKTEEKRTIEKKVVQQGVNEEEAKRKANELVRQLVEQRRAAEERLKVLQQEEMEAIRKAKEVTESMTHGKIGESGEPTKIDVFQHTHYDSEGGVNASSARVVSGDREVNVDHPNVQENNGKSTGILGSVINRLF